MTVTRISVGLAQIAPVWLNRDATIDKVVSWIEKSANEGCSLLVFGEALLPGYPFWVERTDGACFESELQKSLFAHYLSPFTAGGLMRKSDIGAELPHADLLNDAADELMADGGSCVAAPNGEWLLEPQSGDESLYIVELDHKRVLEERHSLDVTGHYSRPDVLRLVVNRKRQTTAEFSDD